MAAEAFDEQQILRSLPLMIGGRKNVAKITFTDGTTLNLPSIASVTSSSSKHSPSPLFPNSTPQRRPRGESFGTDISSTASLREAFLGFTARGQLSHESPADLRSSQNDQQWSTDANAAVSQSFDQTSMADDWVDNSKLPVDEQPYQDVQQDWSQSDLDQLVANADGGDDHDAMESFSGIVDPQTEMGDMFMPQSFKVRQRSSSDTLTFPGFLVPRSPSPSFDQWVHQTPQAVLPALASLPNFTAGRTISLDTVASERRVRKPGRAVGSKLPEDKRKKVASMRHKRACNYCKSGRRGCELSTPCKPCIMHWGAELLEDDKACRWPLVPGLVDRILNEKLKWHPFAHELHDFFGRDYNITDWTFSVPIKLGTGLVFHRNVQVLVTSEASRLNHDHVHYIDPPTQASSFRSIDYVLPVTFSSTDNLLLELDRHFDTVVSERFNDFKPYRSPFHILSKIYGLYSHYRNADKEASILMHTALKLLVLVHNGTDVTVDCNSEVIEHILNTSCPGYAPCQTHHQTVTPCLLRAEFGKIMPRLAKHYLQEILRPLLSIALTRQCAHHPLVLATFSLLLMTLESAMYHGARTGFHAHTTFPGSLHSTSCHVETAEGLSNAEEAADVLIDIYRNCYESCHRLILGRVDKISYARMQKDFGDQPARFMVALNAAVQNARGYLDAKAVSNTGAETFGELEGAWDGSNDIADVFDRYLARLFLIKKRTE